MGGNRAGTIRKQRLKRIKREAARLLAREQADTPESKAPAAKDAKSK
ncbi:MAG: hypothetical protein KJS91_13105 [Planctomycetes bacterium]|jgi:hypothetical protein|nr:hypothetical protein [Planctomycetota bacterium]